MNANMRAWVRALRSGKYKQGRGGLRKADRFCCLGVACELFRQKTGQGTWSEIGLFVVWGSDSYSDFLPDEVATWLLGKERITDDDVELSGAHRASERNDKSRWSFKQIADDVVKVYGGKKK